MRIYGLDLIQLQIESVEQELISISLRHPQEALSWFSMPGIGLVNAATLIAYVGDSSRFFKPEQLMNYAGLVPKLSQSGITNIHGKVTKKGCRCVRRNIVQGPVPSSIRNTTHHVPYQNSHTAKRRS